MLTSGIFFSKFKIKKDTKKIKSKFFSIIKEKNQVIKSLGKNYSSNYNKNQIKNYSKNKNFRIIGMGGSILGAQAIYNFLQNKIKKKFKFVDNLQNFQRNNKKGNYTNLIISKSGNTIETIVNANILIKNKDKNIFITENKKNYLYLLAEKLKAEIIHHNNFIGGRYSVLSEVGMLPAELMDLKPNNFRQLNSLIKNKKFIESLVSNVSSTLYLIKKKNIIQLYLIMMRNQTIFLNGINN